MKEEEPTATDLVFESSYFMAEDMLRTAGESCKEIIGHGRLLFGISSALDRVKNNLRKHVLKHKWTTPADRRKLKKKIAQMDALSKTCRHIAKIHERTLESIAGALEKIEGNALLVEIFNEIDMDNFWENEPGDEDPQQNKE
jgi:hypothetical protein